MSDEEKLVSQAFAREQSQHFQQTMQSLRRRLKKRIILLVRKETLLDELDQLLHGKAELNASEWTDEYQKIRQEMQESELQDERAIRKKITEAQEITHRLEHKLTVNKSLGHATKKFVQKIFRKSDFDHTKETELEYYFAQTQHALSTALKLIDQLIEHELNYAKYQQQEDTLLQAITQIAKNNRAGEANTLQQAKTIQELHVSLSRVVNKQRKELKSIHADSLRKHNKIAQMLKYKTTKQLSAVNASLITIATALYTKLPTEQISQRDPDEHLLGVAFVFAAISAASITAVTITELTQKYLIQKKL